MATKKDLVEAYSFSRRRLVTAFVSGAPGGREVEPSRPGRTIVGGIALAILLVAGAAVLGILKSPTVVDWSQEGLISEKESGADYVLLASADGGEPELRPVVNITSAMLLFGADVESRDVPRDEIALRRPGAPIGILEAPPTPPEVSSLIQTGWTACTGAIGETELGYQIHLSVEPDVTPDPSVGFVVKHAGDLYLIAEAVTRSERTTPRAYAYPVPNDESAETVLQNVAGTSKQDAIKVPADWLTLFPQGAPLTLASFGIDVDDLRAPSPYAGDPTIPDGAKTGDVLTLNDDRYLLTPTGLIKLDAFSAEVYENLIFAPGQNPDRDRPLQQAPAVEAAQVPESSWPAAPVMESSASEICGLLDAVPGSQPGVRLATEPGPDASADGLSPGGSDATVDPGFGAFVLSGDWDSVGSAGLTLIDTRGFSFPVAGVTERDNLGYVDVPDVVVPDAWLQLLPQGVPLSIDAARCPPTSRAQTKPCGT